MQNVHSKDRNLKVWVGPLTFRNFGNFIKHKNELTEDDLKEFNLLAKCIKKLPNEVGKMVMLKYVKLAKFKPYSSREIKFYYSVTKRYSGKPAPNKRVAEEMKLTVKEVSELDKKARHLLADYMLEELKNDHDLVKEKKVVNKIVYLDEIETLLNTFRKKYDDVSYKVNWNSNTICEMNIEYSVVYWKKREVN
ncbi:hypothetical protein HMPREF2811_05455 [Globicatella sp. HMSC072A10]|uniref:hypothetical protein n=1 Tax=Globicatella sp. HMSC072A10 TaxID=1739315 RepID=UPI0008BC6815|nr:hypothetical protein [Globicatella sp. HMSC072A10]OFK58536.1 hypothetical protein HMPREF2811_05455 [Globicatella sp. HMSC072A10]